MFENRFDAAMAPYAATVLRLSLGVMYVAHAMLKILVFTPAGTAAYFESIGLPGVLGYATIGAELIGGILLILGVYSRWIALALIPLLIGTIVFSHGANGWLFSNPGGGWEYSAFLIAASVGQALMGDGAYAVRLPKLFVGNTQTVVTS